jgi:hypothetical protein
MERLIHLGVDVKVLTGDTVRVQFVVAAASRDTSVTCVCV